MSLDDLIARLRWAARTPFFRIPLVSNDRRMSLRGEDLARPPRC